MFSEALKDNTTMTRLYLGYNDIEEKGSRMISEALKDNNSLTALDLSSQ